MRILGIDPSLCNTGWGVIDVTESGMVHLAHGVVKTHTKLSTEKRLASLSEQMANLLHECEPEVVCIEETYCGVNPITTLRLGFASGALLSTCGANNLIVHRYPTRLVKWLVTSNGASSKINVRDHVMRILDLESIQSIDSSDALAVAIAHVLQEKAKGQSTSTA